MDAIVNFFTLRPTFTILGLKLAWYLYLFNVVVQVYISIVGHFFTSWHKEVCSWTSSQRASYPSFSDGLHN